MTCPTVTEIVIIRAPKMDRFCFQARPLSREQEAAAEREEWQVWSTIGEVDSAGNLTLRDVDGRRFYPERLLP